MRTVIYLFILFINEFKIYSFVFIYNIIKFLKLNDARK